MLVRRKGVRLVLSWSVAVVLGSLVVLAIAFWAASPGKPRPFVDGAGRPLQGSIAEKIQVPINGALQGMFIVGRDRTKPVLLFLHGGPGMPEYWLSLLYPTVLEDEFIVCFWEQRGAGLSNHADSRAQTVNVEQLVSDTIGVTNYLRDRFRQQRIYLMGHSWGSILGLQAAARAPQLYSAYIGVAQIVRQLESEKLAYAHMLEKYREAGNHEMVTRLAAIPLPELQTMPREYRNLRDLAMHELGVGTTHDMRSVVTGIFFPSLMSPVYTPDEKLALWRGKWSRASTEMWNGQLTMDLARLVPKLELPVYLLHGAFDYTVAYPITKAYFEALDAPSKGFYTFEHSAHSPMFEEPEQMRKILLQDVLRGAHTLADAR